MVTRLPNCAPSPCHMHPVNNCHHIQSCHPPVKQYIVTHHNTEFIYPSPFFIFSTKVSRARAALWVIFGAVDCIVSVLLRVHPLMFPALPGFLLCSSPSLRSSISSHSPSLRHYLVPSLPRSFPPLILPLSSITARSLPHIIASSLLTLPLLSPSHPPSFRAPSLPPPCKHSFRHPTQCIPCVCMRACGRACLLACVRACVHACVRACLRAFVRACAHAR